MSEQKQNEEFIYFESIDELEEAIIKKEIFDGPVNLYGYEDGTNKLPAIFKVTKQNSSTYVTHMPVNILYSLTNMEREMYNLWLTNAISWKQFKEKYMQHMDTKYIDLNSTEICPYCLSDNTMFNSINNINRTKYIKYTCSECNKSFTEHYTLTKVSDPDTDDEEYLEIK